MTEVLIERISPARISAFETLQAVSEGRYASDELLRRTAGMDARDVGLASQIVFGCLRFQAQLDFLISRYSGRQTSQIEVPVLIALRTGVFQLRYLDRVPPHAAVNETVEMAKRKRKSAGKFVNAVLRKVNRKPVQWPDRSVALSCPEWLLRRWEQHFGAPQALAIARAALEEPTKYIRIPPGAPKPAGLRLEATEVEGCFSLHSPLPAGMRLQDISSQTIVPLLDLQEGQSYLDVCAAPGGKTLQALETPLELAIACDISLPRARQIPPVCPRIVLDATVPLPFVRKFDRIFIDAPCSGTGTLARNPEIKWRVQEEDFQRFGTKQMEIVFQALRHLAPGGRLVYATCSLEPEENEVVMARILESHPGLCRAAEQRRLPGRDPGDGFYAVALRYA